MVRRTEKSIEGAVVAYAKKHGIASIKLSMNGRLGSAGWPDRLFLGPDMQVRWVEFKAPGGKVTDLQKRRHAELGAFGWSTAVVYDVETGKVIIDNMRRRSPKVDPRQMRLFK